MMNMHKLIAILDLSFFKVLLLKNVEYMRTAPGDTERSERKTHPLELNIRYINLPAITDPDIIKTYESIFTYDQKAHAAAMDGTLVDFLMEYPMFSAFGFHKGFGTNLFNSQVQNAYQRSGKNMDKFYQLFGSLFRPLAIL